MAGNYWSRLLSTPVRRRRALAATGATALSAAFLAACGGSSSSGSGASSSGGSNSLVTQPVDTRKDAKRGGTLKDKTTADVATMDVQQAISPLNIPGRNIYQTLVRQKSISTGVSFHTSPDFAESWEVAPDGLTITMKLRAGTKWHNIAPVNGRDADTSDVLSSWNRFAAKAPLRALAANSANPQAPVLSITAPDAKTVAIKLKEPVNFALQLFCSYGSLTGNIVIMPREADNGFDVRNKMIGTGPYFLSDYQPSVGFTLKRFSDFYDQNANFADQINYPIISEYAQVLAQLKAGNLHHLTKAGGLRAEDIFQIKKDQPQLNLYTVDLTTVSTVMTFGQLPAGKTPFLDERVRQAMSMSWDRKAWIDAFYNVPALQAGGLPVDVRWNSAIPADFGPDAGWLDPQAKDFGPNAQNYQHNIDAAKKLLSAAGFPNGMDVTSNRITSNAIVDLARYAETLEGMAQDAGFRFKINPIDYASEYIPKVRDANGQFEGVGFLTDTSPWRLSPISALASEYWSKSGPTFKGFSTNGKNDQSGDPALDALIEKGRVEQDPAKLKGYVQDLQRMLGKSLYGLVNPGSSSDFAMAWPAVRNYQVFRYTNNSPWWPYSVWLDQTKPPFTSA